MLKALLRAAVTAAALTFIQAAAATPPPPVGGLTPLGCFTIAGGAPSCTAARGIDGAESAVVSPDGRNVYVGSYKNTSEEGLAVFSRDPVTGALAQLPGRTGCLTADGASAAGPGTCTVVRGFGIGDGHDLAFTSDGRWAYLVNQHADPADPPGSIIVLERDPTTGALTQLPGTDGCLSANGSSQDGAGTCLLAPAILQPRGISISPDDRFLYVSDGGTTTHIVALARDPATGVPSEVQCLGVTAALGGCSSTGRALGGEESLTISPDGLHAYASAFFAGGGISTFDRDPATGLLQQKAGVAGCISENGNDDAGNATCAVGRVVRWPYGLAISPDGQTLYAASEADNGLAVFHVAADGSLAQLAGSAGCITLGGRDNLGNATCAVGRGLVEPFGTAISPDGRTLYEIPDNNRATDGLAAFALDPTTGAASQLAGLAGCVTVDGSSGSAAGPCGVGGGVLRGAYTPGISPDGNTVYVPAYDGQALAVFGREPGPSCTAANASTTFGAPVAVTLNCRDTDGDALARTIASPPAHGAVGAIDQGNGTVTYTPAPGFTGTDGFTVTASDATNTSAPGTITVVVGPALAAAPTPPRRLAGTVPSLTHVGQSHRRWRERGSSAYAPIGTTFTFTLNEAARVSLAFERQARGRRVRGALALAGRAGLNTIAFSGRLTDRRVLGPGRYSVTLVAASGGRSSRPHTLSFTIV